MPALEDQVLEGPYLPSHTARLDPMLVEQRHDPAVLGTGMPFAGE